MLIIYVIVACKHFLVSPRLLLYLGRSALLWARSPAGFVEDALGDPLVALVVWKIRTSWVCLKMVRCPQMVLLIIRENDDEPWWTMMNHDEPWWTMMNHDESMDLEVPFFHTRLCTWKSTIRLGGQVLQNAEAILEAKVSHLGAGCGKYCIW